MELTPDQQQVVDEAAKDYANNGSFQEWLRLPAGTESVFSKTQRNFKAGVTFALSTPSLYMGLMEELLKWIAERDGEQEIELIGHNWYFDCDKEGDYPISEGQLVSEFIKHLKQ